MNKKLENHLTVTGTGLSLNLLFQLRSLKEHELTHRPKSFACELCDRAFAQPNHLRYHRAAIHGQAATDDAAAGSGDGGGHTCQACGKMFPFAHQPKRHAMSHASRQERAKTLR